MLGWLRLSPTSGSDKRSQAYELVLGAIYNEPLHLGEFGVTPLRDVLQKALDVIVVAEYLGVVCD